LAENCARDQNWKQLKIEPRAELPGQFVPAQAVSLFACRAPAMVNLLPGNMATCQSNMAQVETPLPWLPAAALKNPSAIITPEDYPAKLEGVTGTTRFDMTVGADGRAISCSVTTSSGHAPLDNAACKAFLKRARFSPAKDEQGRAIAGRYKGAVTWKVP
jgi:TonB family protein